MHLNETVLYKDLHGILNRSDNNETKTRSELEVVSGNASLHSREKKCLISEVSVG